MVSNNESKEYFIVINGEKISVSFEIYCAYKRPLWVERKRCKIRAARERSLEAFMDSGFDIPASNPSSDNIIEEKLLLEVLHTCLAELTDDERYIIRSLYYQKNSERMVAREIGVSQNTVNYHKKRLLDKLRKKILKNL